MNTPVLVINRACDTERFGKFRRTARKLDVKPIRIAAIDGHRADAPFAAWSDLIGAHFWGEDTIKPGALACYLSHLKAWQMVVDAGWEHALICEDDAEVVIGQDQIDALASTMGELDILFANDRLSPADRTDTISVVEALGRMEARAPGADCYLVSQAGAARLIDLTEAQKITCGVDWAMVWNALPAEADLPESDEISALHQHLGPPTGTLNAAVAPHPAARQNAGGSSAIRHSHSLPIAALGGEKATLVHTDHAVMIPFGAAQLGFVGRTGKDPVMECHRQGNLWEAEAIGALLRRFPEAGTFVDIGAHLGNHSVALGRLAGAQLIAVEPNPEIGRLLKVNLALNALAGQAEIHAVAAGAEAGPGMLEIKRRKPADSKVSAGEPQGESSDDDSGDDAVPAFNGASPNRALPVEIVAGDTLLDGREVDAIKIDVSGGELDVLKGLRRTLRSRRPLLMVDHRTQDTERVGQFLERAGYRSAGHWPHEPPRRGVSLFVPAGRE